MVPIVCVSSVSSDESEPVASALTAYFLHTHRRNVGDGACLILV